MQNFDHQFERAALKSFLAWQWALFVQDYYWLHNKITAVSSRKWSTGSLHFLEQEHCSAHTERDIRGQWGLFVWKYLNHLFVQDLCSVNSCQLAFDYQVVNCIHLQETLRSSCSSGVCIHVCACVCVWLLGGGRGEGQSCGTLLAVQFNKVALELKNLMHPKKHFPHRRPLERARPAKAFTRCLHHQTGPGTPFVYFFVWVPGLSGWNLPWMQFLL